MNDRVMIAMSGGVDSSVAARILKDSGYDCMGVTMRLFSGPDIGVEGESACCSLDDAEDARSVARSIGIPFHVFNFSDRFREKVIERFVAAYERGRTPNPCIDCNRFLKFDKLFARAGELGYDRVATGHYARIERDSADGRYLLKKAVFGEKDQSYVLYAMTQEQLEHTLFPLGELSKPQVRAIAEVNGFINAAKRESQDICFVPDGDYAAFIERYTGRTFPEGDFVGPDGTVLGRHRGVIHYTIGQRRGLGVAFTEPLYVCGIDVVNNTVTLGTERDLYSTIVTAEDINLISVPEISGEMRVRAKIRYRQKEQPATVRQTGDDMLEIRFDEPQRAVTKGQAVVLYDGDTVVGGGTIC